MKRLLRWLFTSDELTVEALWRLGRRLFSRCPECGSRWCWVHWGGTEPRS